MRDRYKIANCHMLSTLYVGACDVLVMFDDACPTSSDLNYNDRSIEARAVGILNRLERREVP